MAERSRSLLERVFIRMGLHPVAHRPPLIWRFWVYSVTAYLLPVVVHVFVPPGGSTLDELVWLVTLVPAFLLALHFGLRGAFMALLLGIALLVSVQLFLVFADMPGDPRFTVPIFIAYGALAISVGWLSEELHEHYGQVLELEAAQKAEALGTMAAGIAHDFNNILTAMVANAELIATEEDSGGEDARRELDQLKKAARRGSGIVRNLLGFSRRSMLRLKPVDLSQTTVDLEGRVREIVPDSIEVRIVGDDSVPPAVADGDAVDRIIMNLVTNARDAMPEGGTLEIEVRGCRLEPEHLRRTGWGDPGAYVCVSVRDTGTGMDEKTTAKIFEPFFSGKEPGKGIGLGMAMVYGLMKQHRGFVEVESVPGEGTTVRTYFPVAKDRVAVPHDTTERKGRQGAETILLVEDELAILRATRRILERSGYTVWVATDGEEALQVYEEGRGEIDLILSDVMLPKLSGPEVYEAIRADVPRPRILFMSGYPAHTVRDHAALDPALPFLQKPWTVQELVGAVRRALDEDRARIAASR